MACAYRLYNSFKWEGEISRLFKVIRRSLPRHFYAYSHLCQAGAVLFQVPFLRSMAVRNWSGVCILLCIMNCQCESRTTERLVKAIQKNFEDCPTSANSQEGILGFRLLDRSCPRPRPRHHLFLLGPLNRVFQFSVFELSAIEPVHWGRRLRQAKTEN